MRCEKKDAKDPVNRRSQKEAFMRREVCAQAKRKKLAGRGKENCTTWS